MQEVAVSNMNVRYSTALTALSRRRGIMSDRAKKWLRAAGIRAVKTMAQTMVALLPAAATISQVDWLTVIGTAALAGVASILTSLAGLPELKESEEK